MAPHPPKPIRVWVTPPGPNPWKVIWLLEELELHYETKSLPFTEVKKKPFTDINPNGRTPAIEDPNTDLVLWESGAIIQYLLEQYDQKGRLAYATLKERHLCSQWLYFQTSGQGPYFGQCSWFTYLHAETLPSAIERYANEIRRVLGVLETWLAARPADAQWLVGDKMTFADMAFVPWNERLTEILKQSWDEVWQGLPHVRAWHERMTRLASWNRAMEVRARLMDEQGLQWNGMPKGVNSLAEYEKQAAGK